MYQIVITMIYLFCFGVALYSSSAIKFEKFCNTTRPEKVQWLWILLSICMAYLAGNFLIVLMNYK